MSHKRVLVIGLDGIGEASLAKARGLGLMPFWDSLCADSTYGTLHSVMPCITPVAWSSFHTGCEPLQHGVLDWRVFDRYKRTDVVATRALIRRPTIWQLASQQGRRVACLGVPMCYPPDRVNGVMVSGFDTPFDTDGFSYPDDLAGQLRESIRGFTLLPKTNYGSRRRIDIARTIDQGIESLRVRTEMFERVVTRDTYDLAMIQFQSTDWVQHRAWMYIDPQPLVPPDPQREAKTLEFFAALDGTLRRVVAVGEDRFDALLVLSDHGFGRSLGTIYPNVMLKEMGFLAAADEDHAPAEGGQTNPPWYCKLPGVGPVLGAARQTRWAAREGFGQSNQTVDRERRRTVGGDLPIDWKSTMAYSAMGLQEAFIYLNDQNPAVCSDRAGCKDRVISAIRAAGHPFAAGPLFERVQTGGDRFGAKASSEPWFPDIIARPSEGYTLQRTIRHDQLVAGPPHPAYGDHRRNGIYLWRGLDAKSVGQGSDARIIDVAPTLLAMLEVPIPDWMDGSPMAGVVKTGRLRSELGCGSDEANPPPTYAPYTDEQRAAVEDRLEALGYIE